MESSETNRHEPIMEAFKEMLIYFAASGVIVLTLTLLDRIYF